MCSIKSLTIDTSTFSTQQVEHLMACISEIETEVRYKSLKNIDTSPKLTTDQAHDDMIRAVLDAPEPFWKDEDSNPSDDAISEAAILFAKHEALVDKFKEDWFKQFRITAQVIREKHGCDRFQELVQDLKSLANGVSYDELHNYPEQQEKMIFRILSEL